MRIQVKNHHQMRCVETADIIDDSLVEGTESFVVSGNVIALASFVPGGDTTMFMQLVEIL